MSRSENHNVLNFLKNHRRNIPDKTALIWYSPEALTPQKMTFGELEQKTARLASGLRQLGLAPGDRALIFLPMSPALYLSMFAVLQLGGSAVFLDSWARKDQLGLVAANTEPKALITLEPALSIAETVPELKAVPLKIAAGSPAIQAAHNWEALLNTPPDAAIEPVEPDTPALITFTTGSSGTPKGANRTHGFLFAQHQALDNCLPYRPDDLDLPIFPIFSLNNLAGGVTTILPAINLAAPSPEDGKRLVGQLQVQNATCCTLSPSLFNRVAEFCRSNGITLASLRRAVTGGAPVSRDDLEAFSSIAPQAEIMVLYGSTEVEPIAHLEAGEFLSDTSCRAGVKVGRISPDLQYKFLKIHPSPIELGAVGWGEFEQAPGVPGELAVCGSHVCPGYYRNPEAMKAVKIKAPGGELWHRTGDVGFLDDHHDLWIVGRVHNAVCRGGEYYFPVEAELLLKKLSFVKQAAFLGLKDEKWGEKACIALTLKDDFKGHPETPLREKITALMAEHHLPADLIVFLEEIPLDPRHHSKVEYSKLKAELERIYA